MKIEVGKKYVDNKDTVWEIVHKTKTQFVAVWGSNLVWVMESGFMLEFSQQVGGSICLIKEYKEPFRDEFEREFYINVLHKDPSLYSFNYQWLGLTYPYSKQEGVVKVRAKIVLEEIDD